MMQRGITLLVDIGNTRLKFGWLSAGKQGRDTQTLALAHADIERLPDWLSSLPAPPTRAIGVNVAGPSTAAQVDALLQAHYGSPVQWIRSSRMAAGIQNLYDEPAQLGADRWVSLIGLASHTSAAAVLASFGTATTVDVLGPMAEPLSAEGGERDFRGRRFEGGFILPGPDLMRRSLANGTAQLPYAEGAATRFPRNTHAAISSGIAAAQAGAVLGQWQTVVDTLHAVPALYCTGGGWPLVADEVSRELARRHEALGLPAATPQWLDAPVLDGLAWLAALATE